MTTSGDPSAPSEHFVRGSPNYIVGLDEIAIKQRKLSPAFPSLSEAAARRRRWWYAFVARSGLALAGLAVVAAIFTDTPAIWSGGAVFIGCFIFGATCFVAAAARKRR